jgi:hypothetical protein
MILRPIKPKNIKQAKDSTKAIEIGNENNRP